ncbi:phage holin [Priestia filamentosa]|uniref:phage holin n=1 Tax=Priestia filamentosa TaxID=1402861 RepID=UPI003983B97F
MNKKIDKGTLIRTLLLFVALINQTLALLGFTEIPISEEEITSTVDLAYLLGSMIFTIVTSLVAWWKNNDVTQKARARRVKEEK